MKMHGIMLAILGVIILNGCASHANKDIPLGLYKSSEGRAISHKSYDKAMKLWNTEYEEDWVTTEYGRTHIIISGPKGAKPLFLLPGLFADATMWYANVEALAKEYRVYAVDLLVYGGKSEPSGRPITNITSYAEWFQSVLRHYEYTHTAVAGLSYGSWLSLALAREVPNKIATLIMLDPSETFAKMRGAMLWKGLWYFTIFPSREKYVKFFEWMGGGYSDPRQDIWFGHMLDVIEYGSVGMMDVPQHRVYTPDELEMIKMPVLVLAGAKPIIYKDPEAFTAAAANALPHAEIELIADTGHGLNMERPAEVNKRMLDFLEKEYRRL